MNPNLLPVAIPGFYFNRLMLGSMTDGETCPGINNFVASNTITQNRAYFEPITVIRPVLVTKLWWINGATSNGNVDVGVYAANDNDTATATFLFGTGSTAQGTVSVLQSVDIADQMLGPGLYYIALVSDSATATFACPNPSVGWWSGKGYRQKASVTIPFSSNLATVTLETITGLPFPEFGAECHMTVY